MNNALISLSTGSKNLIKMLIHS